MLNQYKKIVLLLLNPSSWSIFILKVLSGLRTRFRIKLVGMYSLKWYPVELLEILKKQKIQDKSEYNHIKIQEIFSIHTNNNLKPPETLKILSDELLVTEILSYWVKNPDFKEHEFKLALHRFQFIPELMVKGINTEVVKFLNNIIKIWNDNHLKDKNYAFSPYTISERLINLCVLNCSNNILGIQSHLHNVVENDLRRLKENLEYPASGIINNHILNNARALYITGCYFDDKQAIELGKKILELHLEDMVSPLGVLLENSLHYQLLLTKNMLEVLCVAKATDDKEFTGWLSVIVKKMISVCITLKPSQLNNIDQMSWIGDISPDISTSWFDPSTKESGWFKLWNSHNYQDLFLENSFNNIDLNNWEICKTSKWHAITNTHSTGLIGYPTGHGHEDWGSFCLYFNGAPLIVDPGRSSYEKNNLDSLGNVHSSILFENQAPVEKSHGVFSALSIIKFKQLNFTSSDHHPCSWTWMNTGKWKRTIFFNNESLVTIKDEYYARGHYQVIFPLSHLAKIEKIESQVFLLNINNKMFKFKTDCKHKLELENYFQAVNYGKTKSAQRIKVVLDLTHAKVESAFCVNYHFQFME